MIPARRLALATRAFSAPPRHAFALSACSTAAEARLASLSCPLGDRASRDALLLRNLETKSDLVFATRRELSTFAPLQMPGRLKGKLAEGEEHEEKEEGEQEVQKEGDEATEASTKQADAIKSHKAGSKKSKEGGAAAEAGISSVEGERKDGDEIKENAKSDKESGTAAGDSGVSSAGSSGAAGSGSGSGSSSGKGSESSPDSKSHGNAQGSTTLPSPKKHPDVYPQVLALPLTRRCLFPGFYKAVVVKNPSVIAAIRDMLKRGEAYVGAFLLKNDEDDTDIIPPNLNEVHRVGVFAQITNSYTDTKKNDEGEQESLTIVLYPIRRIHLDDVIGPRNSSSEPTQDDASKKSSKGAKNHDIQQDAYDAGVIPDINDATQPSAGQGEGEAMSYKVSFLQDYDVSLVNVTNLDTPAYSKNDRTIEALKGEIIQVFRDMATVSPVLREQLMTFVSSQGAGNVFDEPDKMADFAAAVSLGEVGELQGILETLSVPERMQKALYLLKKELLNVQLQQKISKDVESKIQKRQREYYLTEQLRGIKKELGIESDGKDKMLEKFREKAATLKMPEQVRKVFDEELTKLQTLEPQASEFNVTRGYLEWLTNIPWGVHSPENYSIRNAVQVLDEDHYGLKDVKDRILEFLAVGKLKGTVQGKIVCLVGPPGVGKTSIGKSIARAIERQFFRFSVGGLSDVAEIKGHRRTYVGAMPGKAIQALKKVGTENPLVLIDEVDKIGRGHNGDPSSALLEMLDPEQNGTFLDHYMDVPVDLSRVLFVCTANTLDTIPQPLLDRMEVIEVNSYTAEEKKHIARGYLAPQAKEASGLQNAKVTLPDATIEFLIKHHARESGVRQLRKLLEKVYRKIAFTIVREHGEDVFPEPGVAKDASEAATPDAAPAAAAAVQTRSTASVGSAESDAQSITPPPAQSSSSISPIEESPTEDNDDASSDEAKTPASVESAPTDANPKTTTRERKPMSVPPSVEVDITVDSLRDYLGPPVFQKDRLFESMSMPAGVSTGLGYLGNGSGSLMPIETATMPGKGNLQLTGKLGDVIKESASIALSWLKSNAHDLGIVKDDTTNMLENRDVHLHMPEGAIGKEGPSAGVAFVTSLVSLLTNRALSNELAMTGEVSLRGMVLPVGGLKEKLLAAHRAGIKKVILPGLNKPNVEADVPKPVLDDLEVHYVNNVWSALDVAFGEGPWTANARKMEATEGHDEQHQSQRQAELDRPASSVDA